MPIEKYYLFNPVYRLKVDQKRVLLYYKEGDPPIKEGISDFMGFIHPVFAMLLSLFDGEKNIEGVIAEFVYITGINKSFITSLVNQLIKNEKVLKIDFNGHTFYFPQNTLLPVSAIAKEDRIKYNASDFLIPGGQLDFTSTRLYDPLDAMLIINNVCVTRCIYCYEDKRSPFHCTIPFPRLVEIIREAKSIGMRALNLSGGEIFTYPHWEKLLRELTANGFRPHISTKYPLNSRRIGQLQDAGIKRIQLSMDTVDQGEMVKLLQVHENYHGLILNTLKTLDKKGFEISINGQITALNQDSMESYFNYLLQFENVRYIRVRATGYSRFPNGNPPAGNFYSSIRPEQEKLDKIKDLVFKLSEKHGGRVKLEFFKHPEQNEYVGCSLAEKSWRFNQRAQCSGNFSSFQILPDGKVTICEELYYHPKFIIGDLTTESIREIWNSKKALSLYHFSREEVREESACKRCGDFDRCHQDKGLCWKLAIYAYGENNWDYPDPRCHRAPEPVEQFWIPS